MNRIKILREEFGYTQKELAEKLNGAKSTVAMYENETRKPSIEILIKLSEIFDCSIDYLLCKSDIRNPKNQSDISINNSTVGMSKEEYEALTDVQKQQIKDFALFIKKQNNK